MKLATLKDGTAFGKLLVVDRTLQNAVDASSIAPNLMAAVESWQASAPRLRSLYEQLNAGTARNVFPLDVKRLHAPLPRSWQWLDASAFHSHGDLLEKVFNMTPPPEKRTVPLMYQGAGDDFLGPCDDMPLPSEADGIDFEGEVAVVVDRVPMGTRAADATQHIKLLMLVNDASLRVLAGKDLRTGFGFLQAKPATSFGPVAVTPDELGVDGWREGRVQLPLITAWNGREFGHPHCGQMGFSFEQLIEHAARTRNLSAGTIIGSGTISNENYREVGSACIAERRGIEMTDLGKPVTEYMKFGDRVRIEVLDAQGNSVFGAIDQSVVQAKQP
ncbi:MAG TPA: fumarylacetoacetate hydrolase family protein [Steroidobacteraceae bacterium]|nr:fumarylacetoacetate hydrolase family protein [Steroidobacteraceae bacterium]